MIETLLNKKISIRHLLLFAIFIFALVIRVIGAQNVAVLDEEAEVLLTEFGYLNQKGVEPSFLQQIITYVVDFIAEKNLFWLRMAPVLAGSLLVLLPGLFENQLGKTASLWLSLFLAVDPFLIANSVVFHSNIFTIFFAGIWLLSLLKNKVWWNLFSLLAIFTAGRGGGYFYALLLISFLVRVVYHRVDLSKYITDLKNRLSEGDSLKSIGFICVLSLLLILLLMPVKLSSLFSGMDGFIVGWGKSYSIENSPLLYPVAIISYIPSAFILLSMFARGFLGVLRDQRSLAFFGAAAFLIVSFCPNHLILDLAWFSVPVWILVSLTISKIKMNFDKNKMIAAILVLISLISIFLTFLNILNNVKTGVWQSEKILWMFLVILFLGVGFVLYSTTFSLRNAMDAVKPPVIFCIIFMQVLLLNRTIGISGRPEQEILWNGYPLDLPLVHQIVSDKRDELQGTSAVQEVQYSEGSNPAVMWELVTDNFEISKNLLRTPTGQFSISQSEPSQNTKSTYLKQAYVAEAYPLWTWQPFSSFFRSDFWSWYIWRDSELYREYNYLLVHAELFKGFDTEGEVLGQ